VPKLVGLPLSSRRARESSNQRSITSPSHRLKPTFPLLFYSRLSSCPPPLSRVLAPECRKPASLLDLPPLPFPLFSFGSPFPISGSLSHLVRGPFQLSLTLLLRYRFSSTYLGLDGVHHPLETLLPKSPTLKASARYSGAPSSSSRGSHPLWLAFPGQFALRSAAVSLATVNRSVEDTGAASRLVAPSPLSCSRFTRRY
jgi:hypothetical protein